MIKTGVLISLAYPEEFVAMIPAWYKKPMEWVGMINDDMICAGHSALALIEPETGKINYADFGRYITPLGKGRTRTELTDPECKFNVTAEFDSSGKILNEEEILIHIEAHPEKTHGAGTMYGSFCYGVDYNKTKKFIEEINLKGSLEYDPFKKNASNCARFVYDTFIAGIISRSLRTKLKLWNQLTPSPLSIVFNSTDQSEVYSVYKGKLELYKGKKLSAIVKHLFLKPDNENISINNKVDLNHSHQWLDGVGASGWFKLSKPNGKYLFERRFPDGRIIFEEEFFSDNEEFKICEPYKLVHDCNALWCTVVQNHKVYHLYHSSYNSREIN